MVKNTPAFIWERLLTDAPPRSLSYASITDAAIRIADNEGLDAVTMRSVAAAVGSGTMSLYRYVSGKEDLLDLMLDAAWGEIPLPDAKQGNWQARLTRVAVASRQVLKAHPWLAALLTSRPTLGPNYLNWFEYLLAATAAPGRSMKTQVRMIGTTWSFVTGFVAYETAEIETDRKHGLTPAKKRKLVRPYMTQILAGGEYPFLRGFLESGPGRPTDEDFHEGLRAVLTGLAAI